MRASFILNFSIIITLILSTIFIYQSLSTLTASIDIENNYSDTIFEYTIIYLIFLSFILIIFRMFMYLFFLRPLKHISMNLQTTTRYKNKHENKNTLPLFNEFIILDELIELQKNELAHLSMEFEKSVKNSTIELEKLNANLSLEKEFANKIIEKLSDVVFVIRDNQLINANNNFYQTFSDLDTLKKYLKKEFLIECFTNLKDKEYIELNNKLYSVTIELFNNDCHIITLIDMTQHYENLKYAEDQNPLTKLPGNESIKKLMYALLKSQEPAVIVYFDFDNFKPFNDKYGFGLGDKMIISFSDLLKNKTKEYNIFNAHIGGDDFFSSIMEPFDVAYSLIKEIIYNFTANAKELYTQKDRENNYVLLQDREGNAKQFPLLSISAVVINLAPGSRNIDYIDLTKIMATMKKTSKASKDKITVASLIKDPTLNKHNIQ